MAGGILIAIDGEPHTDRAIDWSIRLAAAMHLALTGVHVLDPYLKKFSGELYAQGRREYLAHVDSMLQAQGDIVAQGFLERCRERGVDARVRLRHGDPLEEILGELETGGYELLITGAKRMNAWQRFRSRNLPDRLLQRAAVPVLIG